MPLAFSIGNLLQYLEFRYQFDLHNAKCTSNPCFWTNIDQFYLKNKPHEDHKEIGSNVSGPFCLRLCSELSIVMVIRKSNLKVWTGSSDCSCTLQLYLIIWMTGLNIFSSPYYLLDSIISLLHLAVWITGISCELHFVASYMDLQDCN